MGHLLKTLQFVLIVGFSVCTPTDFDYDCTGLPDNFLYWWACGSYGICRGGQYAQIDCVNGTTYDRRTGSCIPNSQAVTFPCNSFPENCLVYNGPGHRYPDQNPDPVENLPPCTFYYTCSYGRYLGHQRCSDGTVYDEPQQKCLPPSEVSPPCGTLTQPSNFGLPFESDPMQNGRQVVQPLTDNFGNVDYSRWPFTNPTNNRRGGGPVVPGNPRPQRLFYRSADRPVVQDYNPAVFGVNSNEFLPGSFANVANSEGEKVETKK